MISNKNTRLRLAIPSKGRLEQPTLDLLAATGLRVLRASDRQYVASIPNAPGVVVLFQRAVDIMGKVNEGSVDLAFAGYDLVCEQGEEYSNTLVIWENLGYGSCELVVAVPQNRLDISSVGDLAEVALLHRERGKYIRIATKYPHLTRRWLNEQGIFHYRIVEAQGAIEIAPAMGYADIVVDITSSGSTLKENHLKTIDGGTVLRSQACLIGNRRSLADEPVKLKEVRVLLELLEGHLVARRYVHLLANFRGNAPETAWRRMSGELRFTAFKGEAISKISAGSLGGDDYYQISAIVEEAMLLKVVDSLRAVGCTDILVFDLGYIFDTRSQHYQLLIEKLKRQRRGGDSDPDNSDP